MADKTEIAWTDSTFNPWIGCTKVGPGCDHCYAERDWDHRFGQVRWGSGNPRHRTSAGNWNKPLQWERQHEKFFAEHGNRRRVFCASLADVFDNEVPGEWRADLFSLIEETPHLDWLLLTKRIGNVRRMLPEHWVDRLPRNIWLGITVVNQAEADRDIPKLLEVPAGVRFLSMEPLLEPVTLPRVDFHCDLCGGTGILARWPKGTCHHCNGRKSIPAISTDPRFGITPKTPMRFIHWVIVGGESGPDARPMHLEWARSLRDQCDSAGVPFHFKQWGEYAPNWFCNDAGKYDGGPIWMDRMGKKAAGRLLDGVEHNGYPEGHQQ